MKERIGKYRVVSKLGTGGMGTVYLGEDEGGVRAAVKVLHPQFVEEGDENLERFRHEAEIGLKIQHDNVVRTYGARVRSSTDSHVTRTDIGGTPPAPRPERPRTAAELARAVSGAKLLRKVFEVDPRRCPRCGGSMAVVATAGDGPRAHAVGGRCALSAPRSLSGHAVLG